METPVGQARKGDEVSDNGTGEEVASGKMMLERLRSRVHYKMTQLNRN